MFEQVIILMVLYIVGLLFMALFYPRVPIYIAISSGLFWGALLYIFIGVVLGILGLYSRVVWIILAVLLAGFITVLVRRKKIWKTAPWKNIFALISAMFILFTLGFLILGGRHRFLLSTDSLNYIVYASHIYNYGSFLLRGAGYFFRGHFGISEVLIHSLGRFGDTPAMTLWHPFLWISLYAFFAAVFYDAVKNLKINTRTKIAFGIITVIWTATASMNWLNSFYIHVHLFASFCIFTCIYFFWKVVNAKESRPDLGFLGALALCGFVLSRVESPIVIMIFLTLMIFEKKFSRREIRVIFYPPIILEIGWLVFLYFGYRSTETSFWSDSRLLLAIGGYFLFLVIVNVWEKTKINFKGKIPSKLIVFGLLAVPLLLYFLDSQKLSITLSVLLTNTFGTIGYPGRSVWNFYWIGAGNILLLILAIIRPLKNKQIFKNRYALVVNFMLSYLIIILALGLIRETPYSFNRWGDSSSRMISHFVPSMGLFIGICVVEIIAHKQNEVDYKQPDYRSVD